MSNAADARRRWFGVFFLIISGGMLIWGQTILKPHLKGLVFIGYWLTCFGFTFLAMLTALLDYFVVRQRSRLQQRDLIDNTLRELKQRKERSEPDQSEKR